MLTFQIKNEIKYNFIDYKRPVNSLQNDFRTSTYLGHRYYKQNDEITPTRHSIISPCYTLGQKEIRYDYATEKSSQFRPKLNFNRTNKANLNMCCTKPGMVNSIQHDIFNNPPRAIRCYSAYSKDYVFRPKRNQDVVIFNKASRREQSPEYEYADVGNEGYYKYDSTNMTVYKEPKDVEVPGCNKNTITVWNYMQKPKFVALDLPKYNIVPNRLMILKHNGMKSENQHSFIVPVSKKFKCDDVY